MNPSGGLWLRVAVFFVASSGVCANCLIGQEPRLAPTPPMGWNSWDAFGEAVKESDIRTTADWIAKNLKSYGWQYVVVDSGWYVTNHGVGFNAKEAKFSLDDFGRYTPAVNTFPSAANGTGFRPLADYVHRLGLKFGLHILRGIPKEAVSKNLPIQGSTFRAQEAANTADTCPWNPFNYGLDATKLAAQAYYDSLARQFVEWGVDFVKIDCISSRPYKGDEIRLISQALRKTGRPIVLSLSPGAAPLDKADEMAQYAQMWRISDDEWDVWNSSQDFPQGVNNQFERAAQWAPHSRPGNWPDADMLAIGRLQPSPGWGEPRQSRLTHDEQRTLLTLWSIFRSPLIIGANLLQCDDWTKSLLTNAEVIALNQHSKNNHPVPTAFPNSAIWLAERETGDGYYLALFNRSDAADKVLFNPKMLGIKEQEYRMRDLWTHKDFGQIRRGYPGGPMDVLVRLPAHGCALYLLRPAAKSEAR